MSISNKAKMIHTLRFDVFMERYHRAKEDGDKRFRIRYAEREDAFELCYVDIDGVINLTVVEKESILLEARAKYGNIDEQREIILWRRDNLDRINAIEGQEFIYPKEIVIDDQEQEKSQETALNQDKV